MSTPSCMPIHNRKAPDLGVYYGGEVTNSENPNHLDKAKSTMKGLTYPGNLSRNTAEWKRSVRAKDTFVRTVIEETLWNVPSGRKRKRCDSSVFHRRIFHGPLFGMGRVGIKMKQPKFIAMRFLCCQWNSTRNPDGLGLAITDKSSWRIEGWIENLSRG